MHSGPRDQALVVAADDVSDLPTAAEDDALKAARQKIAALLAKARMQFQTVMSVESELRRVQMEDLKFVASDQWDPGVKSERMVDQRPCLTINRIPQFVRQVTNAARTSRPAVQVSPIDGGADVDTAEVFQGLIRHIEQQSDAMAAYITAAEAQGRIGRGYWRVTTEFDDPLGFTQEIFIKRIRNPFSVVMDVATQELDGSDARYCFIVEDIPKDTYVQKYGNASLASLTEFNLTTERASDWMPEGKIRTAEYWYIDYIEDEVVLARWPDGHEEVTLQSIIDAWPPEQQVQVKVVRSRPTTRKQVKCAVINAVEILEGNDDKTEGRLWPGESIPIVPVIGEEIDMNGQVDVRGMVRDAKDPQRLYNYQNTALAEALALAPKAPYVGYEGQFEGHEIKWRQANRRNFPYLEAKPVTLAGTLAPLPRREVIDPGVQSIVVAIAQADNDLKATTGLYDPSLGQRQGDQSGKAIAALQKQGEMANSNYLDNLARGIRRTGRILIDLIPKIYDAPRVVRIIGTDEKPQSVMVHAGTPPPSELPPGVKNIYDLSVGRYDVAINVGPSLESKRQEAVQGLSMILQANPQSFQIIGDLVVENMDWPGARAAASRLRKLLPPMLQDEDPNAQIPPQVAAQMQQMQQQTQQAQQQLQELQQKLAEAQRKIDGREVEMQGQMAMKREEIAARERADRAKAELAVLLEQVKLRAELTLSEHQATLEAATHGRDHAHDHATAVRNHALTMAQDDAAHARQQASARESFARDQAAGDTVPE